MMYRGESNRASLHHREVGVLLDPGLTHTKSWITLQKLRIKSSVHGNHEEYREPIIAYPTD